MAHGARHADPLERVGLEDAAVEPLWDEAAEADEPQPFVPEHEKALSSMPVPMAEVESPQGTSSDTPTDEVSGETVLMEELSEDLAVDEEPTSDTQEPPEGEEASAQDESVEHDPASEGDEETSPEAEGAEDGEDGPDDVADDAEHEDDAADTPAEDEDTGGDASGAQDDPDAVQAFLPLYDDRREGGYRYSSGPFETIHADASEAHRSTSGRVTAQDAWQGRSRPSERRDARLFTSPNRETPSLAAFVAIALALMLAVGTVMAVQRSFSTGTARRAEGTRVSTKEASEVIDSLDGWWKTDRTLDGRYWFIQGRLLEQYGADGKLYPTQKLLDPGSVERMSSGPGDIEGSGYYLRDVGFYLVDGEPDTLHVIEQDGSADEDANLFRTDPPDFPDPDEDDSTTATPLAEGDASEYILPESSTRIYLASELEELSDHDLFVARNEIFARHGYTFMSGELSEYFASKSWYHPSDSFNEGELSEIERENVNTILSIEQASGSQYQ